MGRLATNEKAIEKAKRAYTVGLISLERLEKAIDWALEGVEDMELPTWLYIYKAEGKKPRHKSIISDYYVYHDRRFNG